jgi:hypothetical protein
MFKKYMKIISQLAIVALAAMLASLGITHMHLTQNRIPAHAEFRSIDSMSNSFPVAARAGVRRSINSAVRIVSYAPQVGHVSVSTGTYFKHRDEYFILTVRHGIATLSCKMIQVEVDGTLYPCDEIVTYDERNDYAILLVGEIINRKPIKFPQDFVTKHREWIQTMSPLEPLVYTGYPNTIGPVTLSGRVMGISADEYVYFNSYAWSGSSGSGVFNSKGKIMGYIVAIDVGHTEYGIDVLENVILVVPHYRIDWSPILKRGK